MESSNQDTKQINKECRFYENEMPDEHDHVIIQISRVDKYAVFVQLLEYDHTEGMIILAEYSRSKKSRINQGLLQARKNINKKDVCLVLRVDKDKKNIDLTKRKINATKAKEAELRFQKSKKVQSLFYPLCDKLQKSMLYFHEQIVWPLQRSGAHAADIFQIAIFKFDQIIDPLNLDKDVKLAFEEELKKKFTPKPLKIKSVFKMTCQSLRGIEDIKLALKEGQRADTEDIKLQVQIIAAPKYWIQTTTINFIEGEKVLNEGLKFIEDYILKHEGTFEILEAPTDLETDDQIENFLNNNKKQQQQKMEEDNSDGIHVDIDEEIEDN